LLVPQQSILQVEVWFDSLLNILFYFLSKLITTTH
jgi:hypothetical protein